jgi:hypothetical protein
MRFHDIACVFSLALLTGGCAWTGPAPADFEPSERCEDIVAEGVATTPGQARWIAREGVRQQTADVRGNLLRAGLHQVRVGQHHVRCQPHSLGLGLTTCTATARACGR